MRCLGVLGGGRLAVAIVIASAGCANGGSGDVGAGDDGGADAGGLEGAAPGTDAGGGHDAASSGGSGGDSSGGGGPEGGGADAAGDGGAGSSGGHEGGPVDSGGGNCTAVTVTPAEPTSGGAACSPSGTCYPHDVTTFTPAWVPPLGPHAGKCTAQQIGDFYTECLGTGASGSACATWTTASANTACDACLETQHTASAFGALVEYSGIVYANLPGCVAIVEPCNQACAQAVQALTLCDLGACNPATYCPSQSAYDTCRTAAESGTCACDAFAASANCMASIAAAGHPAYATCFGSQTSDFQTTFTAVATVICGP